MRIALRSTYPFFLLLVLILGHSFNAVALEAANSNANQKKSEPVVRDQRVLDAARMYEKYFLNQMVKAMRGTVSYSDLQKPTMGEEVYRDQLDDQYVDSWTESGGIGLANMIHDELIGKAEMAKRRQEAYRQARAQGKQARTPIALTDRDVLHVRRLPSSATAEAGTETVLVSLAKTQQAKNEGPESVRLPWDATVERVKSEDGKAQIGLVVAGPRHVEMAFDGVTADVTPGQALRAGQIVGHLSPQARGILIRQQVRPQNRQQDRHEVANLQPERKSGRDETKVQKP